MIFLNNIKYLKDKYIISNKLLLNIFYKLILI